MNYVVGVGNTVFIRNPQHNVGQYWYLTVQAARDMANALSRAADFMEDGPTFTEICVESEIPQIVGRQQL